MNSSTEHVIRPDRGWTGLDLQEIWSHRGLLYFLVWREIKVRYKQTVIGVAWALLQPLGMMAVFTLVFGMLLDVETGREGLPYALFCFAGVVPWCYFSQALSGATHSLVEQKEILTRVYFPRLLLPLSGVVSPFLDLALGMLVLAAMMGFYGIAPTGALLVLPLLLVLAVGTALALGLWLSALNALYRDFRFIVPFGLQLMFFCSPVIYSSAEVPDSIKPIYGLNPMVGVIEGFRWALIGTLSPPTTLVWVSAGIVTVLLVSGLVFFRRVEGTIADVV